MNANQERDKIVMIREFVARLRGMPVEDVHLRHSFFHDLGVDGDDAIELINEYSEQFNVSLEYFDLDEYFGPEEPATPLSIITELITKYHYRNTPRLTVQDLVNGVNTGKLEPKERRSTS